MSVKHYNVYFLFIICLSYIQCINACICISILHITEFSIFVFLCVPCFQRIFIQNLCSLQLVLCRVAAVKRLPVHHDSADYIFSGPLGSLGSF